MSFNVTLQGSSSWAARCLLNLLEVYQNACWAHEEGWQQEPVWPILNLNAKYYTGNVFRHLHDDICWQIVCTHKFHNPILNGDLVLQMEKRENLGYSWGQTRQTQTSSSICSGWWGDYRFCVVELHILLKLRWRERKSQGSCLKIKLTNQLKIVCTPYNQLEKNNT